jgi:hypothetical protein
MRNLSHLFAPPEPAAGETNTTPFGLAMGPHLEAMLPSLLRLSDLKRASGCGPIR